MRCEAAPAAASGAAPEAVTTYKYIGNQIARGIVMSKQQLCEGCDRPLSRSDQFCTSCGRALPAVGTPTIRLRHLLSTTHNQHMAPERRAWLWLVGFVGFVLLSGLLVHG